MIDTFVHVGRQPRDVVQERLEHLLAALGVRDLGVELHAVDARGRGLRARRPGRRSVRRGDDEARSAPSVIASTWLIHTTCSTRLARRSSSRRAARRAARCGRTRRVPVLRDLAAEIAGDELRAVTDAEHGHAGVVDRGVDRRRAVDVHRRGTAREDDRLRLASRASRRSASMRGTISRVDVRLAHAPGDQLRVLRPEVDDENECRADRHGVDGDSAAHADALRALERLALGLQRRARP